jgi:hypothetical protein
MEVDVKLENPSKEEDKLTFSQITPGKRSSFTNNDFGRNRRSPEVE